jgi:hypothetical protein
MAFGVLASYESWVKYNDVITTGRANDWNREAVSASLLRTHDFDPVIQGRI